MADRTQVILRIDPDLVAEIDKRLAVMNAKGGKKVSRNDWFVNMATWVVNELPHQAVKADLIKAWPNLPPEALGVEK